MNKRHITIVIPALNEEATLPDVYRRVTEVCDSLPNYRFDMLLIDNCSSDGTERLATQFTKADPRWRYLRFSRNFGFDVSLTAGLHHARGDALIFLPSDLQDPPEYIPAMLKLFESQQCEIVYGKLAQRSDGSFLKSLGAHVAYWMIYRLSDIHIPPNATDFRLISRPAIEALKHFSERNRYLRGLVHWVGFRQVPFEYERQPRKHGRSSAGLIYCINFALSAMVAFSSRPLRWASHIGMVSTVLAILGAVTHLCLWVANRYGWSTLTPAPPGWITQVLVTLFFGGVQCFFIGIIGEYLGRTYDESKSRPLWVVHKAEGFAPGEVITVGTWHPPFGARELPVDEPRRMSA